MVRQGGAWAYRHYLKDNSILEAEALARAERLGLWSLPEDEIIPPWDWRHYYKNKVIHKQYKNYYRTPEVRFN
jgi:endonuclease YncB( thermonuclease family)